MISLVALCLASVTLVPAESPILHGGDGFTNLKGEIFISEEHKENEGLLAHEVGHCLDFRLTGTPSRKGYFRNGSRLTFKDDPSYAFYTISWLDTGKKKPGTEFVSDYAKINPFEDLAETYRVFVSGELEERAKGNAALEKKLAWMRLNACKAKTSYGC